MWNARRAPPARRLARLVELYGLFGLILGVLFVLSGELRAEVLTRTVGLSLGGASLVAGAIARRVARG